MAKIDPSNLAFLSDLKANNHRDWFGENRARYEASMQNSAAFADDLLREMRTHDDISTASGKASLFRIYNDTRFAKDKPPYKSHWGIRIARATDFLRGGYYFHLEPGNSFCGGGFFGPNPDDLKRIREDIDLNYEDWDQLFAQKGIVDTFGGLVGEQVKSAPKGYSKEHPGLKWLKYKQFIMRHEFSDKEVLSPDFAVKLSNTFKEFRPFFDYMSEVLTTNSNGESII